MTEQEYQNDIIIKLNEIAGLSGWRFSYGYADSLNLVSESLGDNEPILMVEAPVIEKPKLNEYSKITGYDIFVTMYLGVSSEFAEEITNEASGGQIKNGKYVKNVLNLKKVLVPFLEKIAQCEKNKLVSVEIKDFYDMRDFNLDGLQIKLQFEKYD